MKILIPVDGSANAQRAVDYVIKNIAALKETPQLLLLNVQWNVAAGNVKLFINQQTINDYYREQGMAALQSARAALDAAALPYQYHISIGTPAFETARLILIIRNKSKGLWYVVVKYINIRAILVRHLAPGSTTCIRG